MLNCAYVIFCEDVNLNTSTNQISASGFFSKLKLKEPGTTQFSVVIGVWGIKKGKKGSLQISIGTPDQKGFYGTWTSPESIDESEVYTAIFNCGNIPFTKSGLYRFTVQEINNKDKKEIASRVLNVEIENWEGSS